MELICLVPIVFSNSTRLCMNSIQLWHKEVRCWICDPLKCLLSVGITVSHLVYSPPGVFYAPFCGAKNSHIGTLFSARAKQLLTKISRLDQKPLQIQNKLHFSSLLYVCYTLGCLQTIQHSRSR